MNVRVSGLDRPVVERVAAALDMTVTDLVTEAIYLYLHEVLADLDAQHGPPSGR